MKQTIRGTHSEPRKQAGGARGTDDGDHGSGGRRGQDARRAEQAEEHDGLAVQVKSIDADLGRWREHEKLQITAAVPVPAAPAPQVTYPSVSVKANVPLGTAFVRAACAQLVCKGNVRDAIDYAEKRWDDSTPEVALYLKAAVAPGTTTDATWAQPLVNQNICERVHRAAAAGDDSRQDPGPAASPVQHQSPDADRRRHVRVGGRGEAQAGDQAGLQFHVTRRLEGGRDHRPDQGTRDALEPVRRGARPRTT